VGYEPLRKPALWAVVALAATAVLDVVAVAADWDRYQLLGKIASGKPVTLSEANASDDLNAVIGFVQFGLFVLTAIVFIRWFRRAYRNVEPLGGNPRFNEGWAVGAWFVPVLNLWRPKQIANDIWRESGPEPSDDVPSLLAFWWGLFLLSSWVGQVAARLGFGGDSADELRGATAAFLAGDAVDVVAAVLAIVVVRRLTARQEESARRREVAAAAAGA
jgi:hypothetical protein